MYILRVKNEKHRYVLEELTKEFLPPSEYSVVVEQKAGSSEKPRAGGDRSVQGGAKENAPAGSTRPAADREQRDSADVDDKAARERAAEERDREKRRVFDELSALTGYRPKWGTLTGVRPAKLAGELMAHGLTESETADVFRKRYYVHDEKISLLLETCRNQRFITSQAANRTIGVYIGIPFCPTRCLYCSFASNPAEESAMARYLDALITEIKDVGKKFTDLGVKAESIYVGGGTPTSLSASQLDRLLSAAAKSFDISGIREFCVEAGRPDTITKDKLHALYANGVNRVSINPQSMNDSTLEIIGRSHSASQIYEAFGLVRKSGIPLVNTDIIAGLPGENYADFRRTLESVIELDPDNITVHTLAVKRASRLKEKNENYHYENARGVGNMVTDARGLLASNGYFPYYMYRQKHMAGNHENVSYSKPGRESVYNIRIMDEHQTIAALGAGGISKAYYPQTNRLERVPNVTNYEIYIERLGEMLERKNKALYKPFE